VPDDERRAWKFVLTLRACMACLLVRRLRGHSVGGCARQEEVCLLFLLTNGRKVWEENVVEGEEGGEGKEAYHYYLDSPTNSLPVPGGASSLVAFSGEGVSGYSQELPLALLKGLRGQLW